jgi:hypothetical protein
VQEIVISDGHRDITSDTLVQQLQPGQRVLVRAAHATDGAVFQVWGNHHNAGTSSDWCSTVEMKLLHVLRVLRVLQLLEPQPPPYVRQ